MKTYRQYSKLLPEGIREMFLEELEKATVQPIDVVTPIDAFIWVNTSCGWSFWCGVHQDFIVHYGTFQYNWDAALEKLNKKS